MTDATELRQTRQLRRLSQPIMIVLTVAFALLAVFGVCAAAAILFLFQDGGAWRAAVSFSGSGMNLSIFGGADQAPGVPLDTLDFGQRSAIALMTLACAGGGALAIFHLRQLFALYARGIVFAQGNIRHIKRFGLWLVIAAIVTNLSGRLFARITGEPAQDFANAAMAVVFDLMSWAVAHAMQLGREADLERKEFI